MTFKELLQGLGKKNKERKEKFKELDENVRLQEMIEERRKSANERELERFQKEYREEDIKKELEQFRKRRSHEETFLHNPLDIPNITSHSDFELLREKNMFNHKGNMFSSQKQVNKDNPRLLNNGKVLK